MANRMMTRDEVDRDIVRPLLEAMIKDIVANAKPGVPMRFSPMGDCVGCEITPPLDPAAFDKWVEDIRGGLTAR